MTVVLSIQSGLRSVAIRALRFGHGILCSIREKILHASTPSALAHMATQIARADSNTELLKELIVVRAEAMGRPNLPRFVYDYAVAMSEVQEPIFEDIFKYYSLYASLLAMSELSFAGSLEYAQSIKERNATLIEQNPDYLSVLREYYPELVSQPGD